jgi:uncharacterized membrane protein/3-hydroxymyristoyl/3-hydroxydecanoyl-(acyl carrier protein) dehydratase
MTAVPPRRWRGLPLLLLAYPLLALAGVLTGWQGFSLAAIMLLQTLLLWPALRTRRWLPWLLWLVLGVGMLWLALLGWATLVLDLVPVVLNLLLAWLFGRTLRRGQQPLVSQFIRVLEGPARLAQPGIARYARQLTAFWALLLVAQAGVIGLLLACAVPGGVLVMLGRVPPLAVPAGWAQGYVHGGAYALLAVVFVLEYLFRRWHLRHLSHPRLQDLLRGTAVRWPQLLRGQELDDVNPTSFHAQVCIAPDHPSLAGHFPGQPLVPGVLLLEQVAIALRAWRGQRLARVIEAKFMVPLLPAESAELLLEERGAGRIGFQIRRDGALLARGMIEGMT